MTGTLLESVRDSLLRAGRYNQNDVVPPAAILWPDADGQWRPLAAQLRQLMPELLTLGEYDPEQKTGPAIWLKCAIERVLPEVELRDNAVPVIYLPGVSRQTLREADACPDRLKPLVELQFRGTVWTQRNGKDWTVEAFLVSEDGGLGLDLARDKQTRLAMLNALPYLAVIPVSRLQGKRLEAEDFDKLIVEDPIYDLLSWLSNPEQTSKQWDQARWSAFCSRCKSEFNFDPQAEGEIIGGERLGLREGPWRGVWQRYAESPVLYPGIPDLLRHSKPNRIVFDLEPWPDENETQEHSLRNELLKLHALSSTEARHKIEELEKQHGPRRAWVWARLGKSPLAVALQHLVTLAQITASVIGGDSPQVMAEQYTREGFLADDAVLKALACARTTEDIEVIKLAIRVLYLPWLEDTAQHLQELIAGEPYGGKMTYPQVEARPGQCLLFADGLRYDLGRRLTAMAEDRNIQVISSWRWAALPTVTATAKPAVSPVAEKITGRQPGQDFLPDQEEGNQPLTTDRFRKLLVNAGYSVLGASEYGEPTPADARGWTEFGKLDRLGHALQTGLAAEIDQQLELLLDKVHSLLQEGWREVRVITDHGWLLVPGGLPSLKLPKYLTETRWARCAVIKESVHVEFPVARWHWNQSQYFAFAPGVYCFVGGVEYAHGGVSLQECLVPDLIFSLASSSTITTVRITEVKWFGLRCRVSVENGGADVTADIRTKPNDPSSSIVSPKKLDENGQAGLMVADDSLEGTAVSLVLLDPAGRVVAKQATTVGGDE